MRIITANLNGIRSAARKGFFDWLEHRNADVVCVQEIKVHEAEMLNADFHPKDYHAYFHYAEKKGYSGVGIYSKHQPDNVSIGLGWESADKEGRYIAIEFGGLWIASIYMPSGTAGEHRQIVKYDFLDRLEKHLQVFKQTAKEIILCGDINIAHKQIDLKNWRANQKHTGFLPEERAWMDKLFSDFGFIDAFREINQSADQYTWWSNRGRAREKNVGWRIDYQVVTPGLKNKIKSAEIYKEKRFSDHAPLIMDYDINL